jgi:primase-polymerase (primpol)-like protein
MIEKPQFVNYVPYFKKNSKDPRIDKVTKCPFDAISGRKINALDPKNFLTIEQAISRTKIQTGTIGIGFVLTGEPFCFDSDGMPLYLIGLDIDRKCRLSSGANIIQIKKLFSGAYWERSPSGFGWRAFCLSRKKITNRNKDGFEIYISGRFLTMTGAHATGDVID